MEPVGVTQEHRGRKRRRNDVQSHVSDPSAKRQGLTTRGDTLLLGRYVKKYFKGCGDFLGKIVFYEAGLYRIDYEDGDCEDLEDDELKNYLVVDDALDKGLMERKRKLDELIANKNAKHAEDTASNAEIVKESLLPEIINEGAKKIDDGDLSSDSFNQDRDVDLKAEVNVSLVPPPQLPPSSGNIGVPDEYASYLLSVYGFLRSFSIQLFLSPFTLDDFVGSLNCPLPNTLLDAIHVTLMRVLKRHLEVLASDGSDVASKCMRLMDWSFLDTLTWPIYLVQYLMIMEHISGPQWKGFYVDSLEKSYYSLSTSWKLMILQILCDDVLESVELRSELDTREEAEVGIDPEAPETGPRRVHPRYPKTSACKNEEAIGIINGTTGTKNPNSNGNVDVGDDGNVDECRLCGMDGTLLCCDGCPSAYHSRCIGVSKMFIPEGTWYCPECAITRSELSIARGTSLTGGQLLGIDSYGRIYFGTCDHLLVLEDSVRSKACLRYYHQNDIPKVLQVLLSSEQHVMLYADICKAIIQYWDIRKDVIIPILAKVEMVEQSAEVKDNSQSPPTINMLGDEKSPKMLDLIEDKKLEGSKSETGVENETSGDSLLKRNLNTGTNECYNGLLDIFLQSKDDTTHDITAGNRNSFDVCFYRGLHFKPQAYMNNYAQGDFAASAAASLATLSSEEKGVSERKKNAPDDNLLQIKAFSSVALRFFWPTTDKKLVEVPRERCGWCLSCKASSAYKKACLLNSAASNAIKSAMKILSRLPTKMNGEERLCQIANYIIFMEESLCGLVVGAFQNTAYRNHWRKLVEQATNLKAVKSLLLEFEENIRSVAFSVNWFKLVDSWSVESSITQSATIVTGSTQKRRGRRGRKQTAVSEAAADDEADSSIDFTWWRGGMFSKLIQQRGVLPHSIVKKAARQGGCQKIPGIVYAEGCEIPKRSRQYFWRAAVEMSKNVSELALQVRRLDYYVRWSDLVRPEQTIHDGKGQETEASAYRNAFVCDKKNMENKIIYGVAFRRQKHLPSRVMKNIIEVEQGQDGKEKYWFSEMRTPLYLIKEYEEKVDKTDWPSPDKPADVVTNIQKKQMKACCKDIFVYLTYKRDNMLKCNCASCQVDVILRDAVKCNECEGFCHERCTIGSTNYNGGEVELLFTCKLCHTKSHPQNEMVSPNSPLLYQGQPFQNVVTTHEGHNHTTLTPVGDGNNSLKLKLGVKKSGSMSKKRHKFASWGLIYKKNKDGKSQEEKEKEDEDGERFRMRNILGKRNSNIISGGPQCHLCDQPYNPGLMYILCDTCKNWYHADALEFEESKISDLVGFKCCKCRRSRSPTCPYSDSTKKRTFSSKKPTRGAKRSKSEFENPNPAISLSMEIESSPVFSPPLEEVLYVSEDDPLIYSSSMAEEFPEPEVDTQWNTVTPASRTGPQKLPVRRLVNNDKNRDGEQGNSSDQGQDCSLSPRVEWDVSGNGNDSSFDFNNLNFEDTGFEPQTYFSFNELVSPDIGAQMDEANTCVDEFGNSYGDSQNGFAGEYTMVNDENIGQESNNISASGDVYLCQSCFLADPSPDLCCQNCGLCFHSHCSPWVEDYLWDGQWRCGNCRDWH